MGFAVLRAASSCIKSFFFSASGTVLSALSTAISFLICSGGSVNFFVCGSIPDIIIKIFVEAREAVLPGGLGLHLHLRIRFVWIRAVVEFRHVLAGAHEALNVLLGGLDLLVLLRSSRARIEQGESQKRGEQRP